MKNRDSVGYTRPMTKPAGPRKPAKAAPRPSFEDLRQVLEREQGRAAAVLPPAPMLTEQSGTVPPTPQAAPAESGREAGSPIAATAGARSKTQPPARGRRRKVRPVFIVSLARSGSTLLRYLLDSHPDVVSPPELNLSAILQHVVEVWNRTNEAMGEPSEPAEQPSALSPDVTKRARKVVDEIMVNCANTVGASVYVDKSLTTVDHLPVVSQCYPDAAYIFLYRYPLDLIASGIEASRWGFNAYGFAPYLGAAPGNFVAGLGNYWIDRTSKMLEFERTCQVPHAVSTTSCCATSLVRHSATFLSFLSCPRMARSSAAPSRATTVGARATTRSTTPSRSTPTRSAEDRRSRECSLRTRSSG